MKRLLQNWCLKHLFNTVTIENVLSRNGVIIMLDGEQVSVAEHNALVNEARYLAETQLYKVITGTLRHQAQRKMFEESKSWEDMIAGKMMLHSIGIIENIVKTLK
jgi:hypothetical protein